MVASTAWPPSSCTLNIVLGSASTTSPSTSIFSSLVGKFPSVERADINTRTAQPCAEGDHRSKGPFAPGVAIGDAVYPPGVGGLAADVSSEVRMRGPLSTTATVCSKWAASEPSTDEIDQ